MQVSRDFEMRNSFIHQQDMEERTLKEESLLCSQMRGERQNQVPDANVQKSLRQAGDQGR